MITAFYASLLGLFFTILTFRVLALSGVTLLKWLAFNNFGAQALERSVRAHGNTPPAFFGRADSGTRHAICQSIGAPPSLSMNAFACEKCLHP